MIENIVFHDNNKNNIEIKYFYIYDMVHKGAINLNNVSTNGQVEDVLTKPLSRVKFEHFQENLCVFHKDFPRKGE